MAPPGDVSNYFPRPSSGQLKVFQMANTLLDFVSDPAYNVDSDSPRSLAISIYHRFAVVIVWGSLVMVEMVFVKLQDKRHRCRHPTTTSMCRFAGFLSC